ncbi:thiamine diphosphokinase [Chryseobacterium geocarposphaerae]|uniref:Thiamine diphosphokinase n=1 Tax=Chryseobacterium geocarposphaerae TaxID=1416776 RepID=A0A2M9CAB2_9FLAO|nr:thiamine diphosphokinase [Chryseobacterium geocarposphaerae]PJJ67765.1 thiamine pyrophosphokinase [Chryseobacterium geocarposphaerae]
MGNKALLFINGDAPKSFPGLENYGLIACTDGAFHYLKNLDFPLKRLDFISGDFDSHSGADENIYEEKFIHTPDQNCTDFYKALEIILEKGFTHVDVFGGSGGEQDHFLGNLTVAFSFKGQLNIKFYDEFSEYYFIPKRYSVKGVKDKMISLYPFPAVENITTKGLNWPLTNGSLSITSRIGTRNFAIEDEVSIEYENGDLLIFIGKNYL